MPPDSNMPMNSEAYPISNYCYYLYVAVEVTLLHLHCIICRTSLHKEKQKKIT